MQHHHAERAEDIVGVERAAPSGGPDRGQDQGPVRRAVAKAQRIASRTAARLRVHAATQHLTGPRRIRLGDDDVALVCMLKNGAYYLDVLLRHHRALGIRNFLFIDNGSDDRTREILAALPDVTVVSNCLPVAQYETLLRSQIARQFVTGGWFLFVDSDELIDMAHGEGRPIQDYTRYCRTRGFDAVVGQCLDLFPEAPLAVSAHWDYETSVRRFDRYSLSHIDTLGYHDERAGFSWFLRDNVVSNRDIGLKFGGVRKEMFGENCALTNHRLVRNAPHIELCSHPHCSGNVRCADFTLLLRHYKFAGDVVARERRQLATGVWNHGEDRRRAASIGDPGFAFACDRAHRFRGTARLVEQGFLSASEAFKAAFPAIEGHR